MTPQRTQICAEARTWLGTPYHHQAGVKGAGVDCAMLVVLVYRALGLVPGALDPRPYPTQWHLHRGEEKYIGWVDQYAVEVPTPQPGDMALWRFGRAFSHGGIVVDGAGLGLRVVHALQDARTVVETLLTDQPLGGRPVKYFTLLQGAPA